MVFMITALIIVQSTSVLILTSVFLCVEDYRDPPKDAQKNIYFPAYDFLYSLMLQLTNLQTYVSLIWLYSWWQAFQNSKLKDDLQTCIELSNQADDDEPDFVDKLIDPDISDVLKKL